MPEEVKKETVEEKIDRLLGMVEQHGRAIEQQGRAIEQLSAAFGRVHLSLHELGQGQDMMSSRLASVELQCDETYKEVRTIGYRLEALESVVTRRFGEVERSIFELRGRVDGLAQNLIQGRTKEVLAHESRVRAIERVLVERGLLGPAGKGEG